MKLEVRHHIFKVSEPGKGKRYEVVSAFTPTEAKERIVKEWPDCRAILIESRSIGQSVFPYR